MKRQQQLPGTRNLTRPPPRLTRYTNSLAPRFRSPGNPARTQLPSIPPAAERRSFPTSRIQPRSCPHSRHSRRCSQTRPTVSKPTVNPQLLRIFRGPRPVVAPPSSTTTSTTTTTTTKTKATSTKPLHARKPLHATAKLPGHNGR